MNDAPNKENMDKVQELIAQAQAVKLGGDLQSGVPIDYTSSLGNSYKGTVVFKRPNMLDYMKMGALKSEFLRQAGVIDIKLVDGLVKYAANVMATLKVVAVKRPEWLLNIESFDEPEVLYHIFEKYEDWENSFRKPNKAESDGDSGATE